MDKLLLIDDETDVQYSFRRNFGPPEFEVSTAASGEEGLKLLPRLKPDLVTYAKALGNGYPIAAFGGKREIMSIIHPRAYFPLKLAGQRIENQIIFAVLAFMLIWGGSVIAMTMLLAASGLDIISAVSAVIACLCNTGPGLNRVGPGMTYASLNDFQTWVCTVAMLIGRLELFTLFIVVTPAFWRK